MSFGVRGVAGAEHMSKMLGTDTVHSESLNEGTPSRG